MLKKLWNDEAGAVISAELALVLTVGVLAVIVGISEVAVAVNTELNDISNAIGSLDQSFSVSGMIGQDRNSGKVKAYSSGSKFNDGIDDCDRNSSCDMVGAHARQSTGG